MPTGRPAGIDGIEAGAGCITGAGACVKWDTTGAGACVKWDTTGAGASSITGDGGCCRGSGAACAGADVASVGT